MASGARAQVRTFPEAALRGRLRVVAPPLVQLDGRDERMAPGARIRNAQNMFVLSAALADQDLVVNYMRDSATGLIGDIWVLNADEAAVRRPGARQPSLLDWLFGS